MCDEKLGHRFQKSLGTLWLCLRAFALLSKSTIVASHTRLGRSPDVISYRYMCHSADGGPIQTALKCMKHIGNIISLKLDNKPCKSWGIVVVYSINSSPQLFGEISANSITKKSSLWLSGSSWAVTTSRTWLHLQGKSLTNKWSFHPLGFSLQILAEIKSRILGGQGKTVIFSNFCQGKLWVFFLDVWNFRPEVSERIFQTYKLHEWQQIHQNLHTIEKKIRNCSLIFWGSTIPVIEAKKHCQPGSGRNSFWDKHLKVQKKLAWKDKAGNFQPCFWIGFR